MTCALVTFIFLGPLAASYGNAFAPSLSFGTIALLSLIGGIAGGTAELLPFEVDDNFSIPVISGFVLWLAFLAFGL